uniref:Uncharacterized protein n=1 Tax=Opuntia streptacantha TaxID=393608 RepID=A0A7C8YLK3_OPUST
MPAGILLSTSSTELSSLTDDEIEQTSMVCRESLVYLSAGKDRICCLSILSSSKASCKPSIRLALELHLDDNLYSFFNSPSLSSFWYIKSIGNGEDKFSW